MKKNKVIKVELPKSSILSTKDNQNDYEDSFQTCLTFANNLNSTDIARAFCGFALTGPKWIKSLMTLRNTIVLAFGLKKSEYNNENKSYNNQTFNVGDKMFGFTIFDRTDKEIVFGKNDKHLNFKSSFLVNNKPNDNSKIINLSTVVKYNNWLGKLYFIPVRPFHHMIMRTILGSIQLNETKR